MAEVFEKRLKQVLDFAEARAQQAEPRCLSDEYQIRRLNNTLHARALAKCLGRAA